MMKKALFVLFAVSLVFSGCDSESETDDRLKVGMVTDAGTIDDKSFNEGTWMGILRPPRRI